MTTAHGLILFELGTSSPPALEVVDVRNPAGPVVDCTITAAEMGQFAGSSARIRFLSGDELWTADLTTQTVHETAQLPELATEGTFSADSSKFAYRFVDSTGTMTTRIFSGGHDQVLYEQPPIGGHGGPPVGQGPFDQLAFSPDGSLLLDYMMFRPSADIPNLQVFSVAGTPVLQESGQVSGMWAPSGATLYYPIWTEGGFTGEVDSFDVISGSRKVAAGINGFYWPAMAPDGKAIVFDAYDSSVPGCGGWPHLWKLDLATGRATQVATAVSSHPVFVASSTVWSNHEVPAPCGPGGASAADGQVVVLNLATGAGSTISMRPLGTSEILEADVMNVVDALL